MSSDVQQNPVAAEDRPSDALMRAYTLALQRHGSDMLPRFRSDFVQWYADGLGRSGMEAIQITDYDGLLDYARTCYLKKMIGVIAGDTPHAEQKVPGKPLVGA